MLASMHQCSTADCRDSLDYYLCRAGDRCVEPDRTGHQSHFGDIESRRRPVMAGAAIDGSGLPDSGNGGANHSCLRDLCFGCRPGIAGTWHGTSACTSVCLLVCTALHDNAAGVWHGLYRSRYGADFMGAGRRSGDASRSWALYCAARFCRQYSTALSRR